MATIRYLVDDVDEAIAFYARLGFALRDRWGPSFAVVVRGGLDLWLSGPGTSAARPMPDGARPEPGGWNRLVLLVEDLAGVVADLEAQGCSFRNRILKGPGGQQILVEDPSGNPIELFEPLE